MPCNHWWRLTLSAELIFCALFKYLRNTSFLITLCFTLATVCTGISKVYWKVFLNIPEKFHLHPQICFGIPNGTKNLLKAHCAAWSDIISFIPVAAAIPNPFIQSRHVRILQYPSWSGMSPGSQKSRITTSNGVSDSIVWSNCCALWDHEFNNWQLHRLL